MGTAERRERERLALQQKIIDKGREILVKEGHAALTMRRLADEIEYTPGALYAHFADKDALVRAICTTDFVAFGKHFAVAQTEADPLARMRLLARLYARFALEHPAQYKTLFVLDQFPSVKAALDVCHPPEEDAYSALEDAVRHAIDEGHFAAFVDRPQLVVQSLWAAMHGVVSIEIRRSDEMKITFEPIEDRVEAMCEIMLAGLEALDAVPAGKADTKPVGKRKPAPRSRADS